MSIVEAKVNGLILEHKSQQNVVVLRETDGDRILPIWIGPGEAQAIRRLLSEEPFPRPLTHDLFQSLVDGLRAKILRVVIADLRENTFFATLIVQRGEDMVSIDARPSDSIAVALRARAPIFVNEKLLQEPPREEPEAPAAGEPPRELTEEEKAEQLRRFLERLDPEDFGKFQL